MLMTRSNDYTVLGILFLLQRLIITFTSGVVRIFARMGGGGGRAVCREDFLIVNNNREGHTYKKLLT